MLKVPAVWCQSSLVILLFGIGSTSSFAADERPPAPELPQQLSPLDGSIDPVTQELLSTFEPKSPAPADQQQKNEALARYLAGRVAVESRDIPGATESFRQAVELNPQALQAYGPLIRLLMAQEQMDEAKNYALRAARENPDGYQVALVVALEFASRTQVEAGIDLLQSTLAQGSYRDGTREYLVLHREIGVYSRVSGQIKQAAEHYEIVLKSILDGTTGEDIQKEVLQDPAKNFDEFGDTFLKAGQPELALKAFEQALKYREAKPGLHSFNLATVFQQTGKPQQALTALQEYLDAQLQGRGVAAYLLLEKILKDLGREGELIRQLEELLAKDEFNDILRFFLADRVLAAGDLARAKELFLKNSQEVSDPRAMVGMLHIYRVEGDSEKLLALISRAFQVIPRPDDPDELNNLADDFRQLAESFDREIKELEQDEPAMGGLYAAARRLAKKEEPELEFAQAYWIGKMATEAEQTEPAIEFYRMAIGMQNDPPFLLYKELSSYLIDAKEYKQAIDLLNEALTHPSNSLQEQRWLVQYFLSLAYEYHGETQQALDAVDGARSSAPDDFLGRLLFQKGWIHTHAHNFEQALNYFQQVVAQFPNDQKLVQDSKFTLSTIYVEQGDTGRGEQELLDILKAGPYDSDADARVNNDLGYLWADQGKNLERSREMIKKALDAEPDNPAYLDSYGWVLYRLEDFQGAVEHLRKATAQERGDDSTIFDHLGDALLKVGANTEALTNFEKALKIETEKEHPSAKLLDVLRQKVAEKGSAQNSQ